MNQRFLASHAFALFCFVLALYLSLGGYLQWKFGSGGIIINQIALLLLPALLYSRLVGLSFKEIFPIHLPTWRDFLLTLVLTALVIAPIEVLIHFQNQILPLPQEVEKFYEELMRRPDWQTGALQFLTLALVPAICEELFFRGFMQSLLAHRFGRGLSLVLTALFFALAHMNPWYLPYYFFLGLYLGWLRYWQGNLALCILAHLMNNLYSLYA